jgi:calcineurin-like phosphoesterase
VLDNARTIIIGEMVSKYCRKVIKIFIMQQKWKVHSEITVIVKQQRIAKNISY